jgi:hypothetical protein
MDAKLNLGHKRARA